MTGVGSPVAAQVKVLFCPREVLTSSGGVVITGTTME